MTVELREAGYHMGQNRVARLMREHGILARHRHKYKSGSSGRHNWPVAENMLNRCFTMNLPDRGWVADIPYIPTGKGWFSWR